MTLKIKRADLLQAASDVGIEPDRGEALWAALDERGAGTPRFDAVHVLYYFGALLSILGMGIFGASQWDYLSGLGIAGMGLAYAAIFLGLA